MIDSLHIHLSQVTPLSYVIMRQDTISDHRRAATRRHHPIQQIFLLISLSFQQVHQPKLNWRLSEQWPVHPIIYLISYKISNSHKGPLQIFFARMQTTSYKQICLCCIIFTTIYLEARPRMHVIWWWLGTTHESDYIFWISHVSYSVNVNETKYILT